MTAEQLQQANDLAVALGFESLAAWKAQIAALPSSKKLQELRALQDWLEPRFQALASEPQLRLNERLREYREIADLVNQTLAQRREECAAIGAEIQHLDSRRNVVTVLLSELEQQIQAGAVVELPVKTDLEALLLVPPG